MKRLAMLIGLLVLTSCGTHPPTSAVTDVTVGKGLWASIISVRGEPEAPPLAMAVGCPVRNIFPIEAWSFTDDGRRERLFLIEAFHHRQEGAEILAAALDGVEVLRIEIDLTNAWSVTPYIHAAAVTASPALIADGGGEAFMARRLNEDFPAIDAPGGHLGGFLSSCSR